MTEPPVTQPPHLTGRTGHAVRPGDLLADRYVLVDLLSESRDGRFWRAQDRVLERDVAIHVIPSDDPRATGLLEAARRSADVTDRRFLRVLDAVRGSEVCYVVNEWGSGTSLDFVVATSGPLDPRTAAWLVGEVADTVARAHERGVAHGRLIPENVLVDTAGEVRLIGCCVDAALHGLTPDRTADDLTDLGGLLHHALTGRWAGASESTVVRAPVTHGRVLRPRQVRAGVPRTLDDLCGDLLAPGEGPGRARHAREARDRAPLAAGDVEAVLRGFVGDPAGIGESLARRLNATHPSRAETVVLPAVPDIALRAPTPREPTPRPTPVVPPPSVPAGPDSGPDVAADLPGPPDDMPEEVPTEVGMPVFGADQDDVSWFSPRPGPTPPPPAFDEPPARPLFAPEPADGAPVRRPRPGAATDQDPETGGDFWPWDAARRPAPAVARPPEPPVDVPGRSWLRLAAAVAAGLLVLVIIVVAYNLGRGRTVLGGDRDPDPGSSSSATPTATTPSASPPAAVTGLSATDLDPQGDPTSENPEDAALAVDGDPATAWPTETYRQQLGPGGLKTGVGLVVDLGAGTDVREVDLGLVGDGSDVSLYLTDTSPTDVAGLAPVAEQTGLGTTARMVLDRPVPGRYLTIWFTALPAVDGGFQGEVAEVRVLS